MRIKKEHKSKKLSFRADELMLNDMDLLREEMGVNWSAKIRKYVEREIANFKQQQNQALINE